MSEINKLLDENIPNKAITKRTQGGKELSYLETWYVIDRLNQVLGTGSWSWIVKDMRQINNEGGKAAFMCIGEIEAFVEHKRATKQGVGYGSDKSNFNPGEMASKEAESDAFKRAAMKFGRSLGLALYDKTQEFVGESNDTNESTPRKETKSTTATALPSATTVAKPAAQQAANENPKKISKVYKEQIKSAFAVLQAQKKITPQEFAINYLSSEKTRVESLDASKLTEAINKKTDGLTEEVVLSVLTKIKTTFPHLNI